MQNLGVVQSDAQLAIAGLAANDGLGAQLPANVRHYQRLCSRSQNSGAVGGLRELEHLCVYVNVNVDVCVNVCMCECV